MLKTKAAEKSEVFVLFGGLTAAFIGGFSIAGATISGTESFADAALTGALPLPYSAASFLGSLIRCIVSGTVPSSMVQIISMVMCVIYKLFFDSHNEPKFCGLSTGLAVFASGIGVSVIIGELLYKIIFYLFYSILAGVSAYAISVIISSLKHKRVLDLSTTVSCAYAIVYTILIASLSSINLSFINLGLIAGVAVTVTAAYHYRSIGGVLCGALTTCGAFIASPECGMSVVMLPAAGLLTGYMSRRKSGTAAGFFMGLNFVFMVFTGVSANSILQLANIGIGTILFLIISRNFSDKWVFTGKEGGALPNILSSRMSFLAGSIETVRKESAKISEVLERKKVSENEVEKISGEICGRCNKRLGCWYKNYDNTVRGMKKLTEKVKYGIEQLPVELENCIKGEEILEYFDRKNSENTTAKLLELRFSESRKMLMEQIKIMEEIAQSAGERIDVRYSESVSKAVRIKLESFGFRAANVIAYYNSENRLLVELYFSYAEAPKNCIRICDLIADELKMKLDYIEPIYTEKEVRIRVFECPKYSLSVYGTALSANEEEENGDTSAVFSDGTGISYVILSDGMGSGRSAAIESRMVVMMFRKLIASGVNYTSAIKLINSIMLTKSQNEAFATLDAARIDLDKCEMTLIKSGASATLIRHRGQVIKITSPTFPIGIVEETEAFSCRCEIETGDIIIMFSDGINESEYQFIKELLLSSSDLKYIVDEICSKSEIFCLDSRRDDVTVIGLKITESEMQ